MRVLVIEDDAEQSKWVAGLLEQAGHEVQAASDGETGLALARLGGFDVMVVDRMLPGRDGLELVQDYREGGGRAPVLFLSALGDLDHRVEGLRGGGDDYLAKGSAEAEILARVEVLGRRAADEGDTGRLSLADLEMDLIQRTVMRAGKRVDLQPREFKLLHVLLAHAGQVVTRTMLLEKVWGYHFDPQTNVVDVHISRLRAKIDKDFDAPLLHTVRGQGYRLQA